MPPCAFFSVRAARLLAGFGQHAGALADAEHVEDQGHAAIAHDGGAGIVGEPLQLLAQRLDHDLLRIVDAVHHQPELPVFRLQNDNADGLGPLGRLQPRAPGSDRRWAADCRAGGTPAFRGRARCACPMSLLPGGSVRAG